MHSTDRVKSSEPTPYILPKTGMARRHVFGAVLGNALEFYDFITFTFFAIPIGHAFFPGKSEFISLMASLATFGAGFITRPIGGVVIGAFADRAGRRAAMMLSFTLMGGAIIALALIPTYAAIGVGAPILAITARLVQGFALGGEVGPNTAYLLEGAAPNQRGLLVSWQGASQYVATVSGALVGLGLAAVMPAQALDAYGWRIAFLLGSITLPIGFWLRRSMPETLHVPEVAPAAPDAAEPRLWRDHRRLIVLSLLILGGGAISTYVINYLTTYARATLHMGAGISFAATVIPNFASLVAILFGGWLSDRIGRRPVMIWPSALRLLLTYPIFAWVVASHSAAALLGGMAVLAFIGSMAYGGVYPALCESLPKRVRGRGFGAVYAFALAVFGGTTQLVVTLLIHITGSAMAPAWYLMGSNVVALGAMMMLLESAPVKLAPDLIAQPA